MIKDVKIIMISLILIGLTSAIGLSQEENINITAYYPSPSGNYDNITASNAVIKQKLVLASGGSFYYADGFSVPPYVSAVPGAATTTIDDTNTISTTRFQAENYYSPRIHARTLHITSSTSPWKVSEWEVSGSTFGLPVGLPLGHRVNLTCPDGFINSVTNITAVASAGCLCIIMPLAICPPMQEQMIMLKKCINPV